MRVPGGACDQAGLQFRWETQSAGREPIGVRPKCSKPGVLAVGTNFRCLELEFGLLEYSDLSTSMNHTDDGLGQDGRKHDFYMRLRRAEMTSEPVMYPLDGPKNLVKLPIRVGLVHRQN